LEVIPVMRPWLGAEEAAAASAAIESGWVAQGPRVAEFEARLAEYVGADHAVAVSSCTTALHLALHVLGVGPGDEVIVPSLSFIATANAPRYVGATPVFADVDPLTHNLTAETIESALSARTRAVIVVHQVGMPADLDPIERLCDERGIELVEDAACAIGSTYRGQIIGSHSDLVAFSFHPRKVLTTGEGGMLTVADAARARRLRTLREHAMSVSAADRHAAGDEIIFEEYPELGFNYRMTDIQAAVGIVQLSRTPEMVERRRVLADRYALGLAETPGLTLPTDPPHGTTNYQSYAIVLGDDFRLGRDDLMRHLADRGISTRRGVMAAHREPAFAGPHPFLPETERLADHAMILPLYHQMSEADQDRVIEAIVEIGR
jgi:perosamine synthetase